jgi:hypothetical protein
MYYSNFKKVEIARYYVNKGFSVLPCHTIENGICSCGDAACDTVAKHPLTTSGVKSATKDLAILPEFFSEAYEIANIAIATGEPSGVWILDEDDSSTLNGLEAIQGTLPKTWKAKTGKGFHHYFRFDERCRNLKNSVKFCGDLDVRTTGGYALLPPSLHASGKNYEWIVSPDDCDVADAPDWLIDLIISTQTTPKTTSETTTKTIPEDVQEMYPNGNVQTPTKTFTVQRAKSEIERLKLYLEKTPPAISGENGHSDTFGVICRSVELFGSLSDDDIIDGLKKWNKRCSPPWSDKELRHKLQDSRRHVSTSTETTTVSSPASSDMIIDVYPTLSSDAYHGITGEILKAVEPETEADIVGVLLSLLCAFGNALGKTPHVCVGASRHGTNLNVALVGDTASGKGQAYDIVKTLMSADDDWLKTSIAYGLSSGEGLVERVQDNADDDNDFKIPDEKRLLCLETEFARPIIAMRREGNTLSPLLRSAWDGQTLEIMTRGKSKLRASNAHVSVLAHITIDELKKLFSGSIEVVNGFGNRFLWTLVRSSKSLPHGGNANVLKTFANRIANILERSKLIGEVKRSAEADKLWETVYAGLKESKPGNWGKSIERGRPYVVRLSLIYALLDCSPIIDHLHLKAALAVWRYCEESAYAIFADDDLTIRLRTLVRQQPGIMRSELRQAVSHSIKTETFDSALRWLCQRGDIVSVPIFEARHAECFYPGAKTIAEEVMYPNEDVQETIIETTTKTNPDEETTTKTTTIPEEVMYPNATLIDLLNWKNANGIVFMRREDGAVWVTNDIVVPSEIAAAMIDHRETLEMLIPITEDVEEMYPKRRYAADEMTEEEFLQELRDM